LRAKSRHDRWEEDLDQLRHEMTWTLLFFEFQESVWEGRAITSRGVGEKGHEAYALKQANMWERFRLDGVKVFEKLKA
jgi:hypothetical protein